jgi:hypothetical protein
LSVGDVEEVRAGSADEIRRGQRIDVEGVAEIPPVTPCLRLMSNSRVKTPATDWPKSISMDVFATSFSVTSRPQSSRSR